MFDLTIKHLLRLFALAALLASGLVVPAMADPRNDESGHGRGKGRHGDREYEYRDGRCKVERKGEKGGEYKVERKCKGRSARARQHDAPYHAAPPPRLREPQRDVAVPSEATVIPPPIAIRP
jgi:hypothetical protein